MNDKKQKITPEQLKLLMEKLQKQGSMKNSNLLQQNAKQNMLQKFLDKMSKIIKYLDSFIKFIIKGNDPDGNKVLQYTRPPVIFGLYIVIIFFGIGLTWSAFAPLKEAAGATGILSANKQVILNKQGGYLRKLFVDVGDKVTQGQKLMLIENVETHSNLEASLSQYRNLISTEARLIAERDRLKEINFPEELMRNIENNDIKELIDNQNNIFINQMNFLNSKLESYNRLIEQHQEKQKNFIAKKISNEKNLNFNESRLNSLRSLYNKGFANKSQLEEIEARYEEAKSHLHDTINNIKLTSQEIQKTKDEIIAYQNDFYNQINEKLRDTIEKKQTIIEQIKVHKENLEAETVRSPVNGTVNVINFRNIGTYISPHIADARTIQQAGGTTPGLIEITPENEKLYVEARIPQSKIASVQVGLKAKIKFSAYKSRTSPTFTGTVTSLSTDTIQDSVSFQQLQIKGMQDDATFYPARIEIDMEEFNRIAKPRGLQLRPGMRVEIMIITGRRTLLRYLLDPITDNMFRAFNEK